MKNRSLTEGPILKALTSLALPIMASAFLGTAYNITDMAWIGVLGSKAVAGVGVGGMYLWLSNGLATLARMGGQVHVAQALGKGDAKEAKEYSLAALWICVLLGILFGTLCVSASKSLVSFFQLDDKVSVNYAVSYLRITGGAIAFSFLSVLLTGLYTAQGDSKTPMKANFIGLILNMILDPVLILGVGPFPRLEVVGAAAATVLSQIVVTIVLVAMISKKKESGNLLRELELRKRPKIYYLKNVFKMGGPAALQSMMYCMFSMVLSRMVSAFGDAAMAVQRVGGQIESLSWNTAEGFGSAVNAFSAQNYGAKKMDRVKKGYKLSAIVVFLWGIVISFLFLAFPGAISEVFFHEPEVIQLSIDYLRIIGIGEAFMCLEIIAIGAISGMGNTKLCSGISILFTGMRIPLAFILSRTGLQLDGIWWALTITSVIKGVVLNGAFYWNCKNR